MGKILSEEERRHMLEKLESKIVATRFMTLKYITSSINQDKVDFAKMDMELPEFSKSLVRIIEQLAEKDTEEMVKREAAVCLENLKKKLNPALMQDVPCVLHVVNVWLYHVVSVQNAVSNLKVKNGYLLTKFVKNARILMILNGIIVHIAVTS